MTTTQRHPVLSPIQGLSISTLPVLQADLDFNDTTLFAVYCFIKNFVGTASNTPSIIDKKIEQALDLVKSHLLFAVHKEVGVLKERISILLDRITQLERENHFLKANAAPDVLRLLYSQPALTQTYCRNCSSSSGDTGARYN